MSFLLRYVIDLDFNGDEEDLVAEFSQNICDLVFKSHNIKDNINFSRSNDARPIFSQVSWEEALQHPSYITHHTDKKKERLLEKEMGQLKGSKLYKGVSS